MTFYTIEKMIKNMPLFRLTQDQKRVDLEFNSVSRKFTTIMNYLNNYSHLRSAKKHLLILTESHQDKKTSEH